MKKVLLMTLFIATIFSVALAQQQKEPKTPEERASRRTEKLTKELSLTADQASKTKAILLDNDQKVDQIKAKYQSSTDKKAMHNEIKAVREQTQASLQQVFTPEQYTKYQNLKEEHEQEREQMKQGKNMQNQQNQSNQ